MVYRFVLVVIMLGSGITGSLSQEKGNAARELLERGNAAVTAGQWKEAISFFNESLSIDPSYADAYAARGAVRELLSDLAGAQTDYNIYLERRPEDARITLARGIVRYKLSLYEPALADFRKVLSLPPSETRSLIYRQSSGAKGADGIAGNQDSEKAYLLNEMGLCETKLSRFAEAIHHFDSAIMLAPSQSDYLVNRGIAREATNDAAALSDYERALVLNPDHSLAKHNLAVLQRKQGKGLKEKDMLSMEADSSMLNTYLDRGRQRFESGYFKGALEDYVKALEIDSSDTELWMSCGALREKLKDFQGAYADYSQAIQMNSKVEKAYLSRGDVLTRLSRYKEAVDDYSTAISLGSEYALAYYNRGLAYQRLKKSSEACLDFSKAASLGMSVEKKVMDKACSPK